MGALGPEFGAVDFRSLHIHALNLTDLLVAKPEAAAPPQVAGG